MVPNNPAWYVGTDGRLLVEDLLAAFQEYFRENAKIWVDCFGFKEAGPQLLLQAFLQRIVNSGGWIEREYGVGRMRTDLLIDWPIAGEGAELRGRQKAVIECKLLRGGFEATLRTGLAQTRAYMDHAGAEEGHLVIFDRTEGATWSDRIFRREEHEGGQRITIWGMGGLGAGADGRDSCTGPKRCDEVWSSPALSEQASARRDDSATNSAPGSAAQYTTGNASATCDPSHPGGSGQSVAPGTSCRRAASETHVVCARTRRVRLPIGIRSPA